MPWIQLPAVRVWPSTEIPTSVHEFEFPMEGQSESAAQARKHVPFEPQ